MTASNREAHVSSPRTVNVDLATRLNKYIPLPTRPEFRLKYVLQRGNVLSFIRSKPAHFWRPNHISELKMRYLSVTENGYLVVYEDNMQGLVIDLREVRNVICNADRQVDNSKKEKKESQFRCHIKIRLPRGNIHLFLREEDVHKWTCAIMRGSSMKIVEEDDLATAIEGEKDSEDSWDSEDSTEEDETYERSDYSDEFEESEVAEPGNRDPNHEEKQKEEEIEVNTKKKWWTRSLRC